MLYDRLNNESAGVRAEILARLTNAYLGKMTLDQYMCLLKDVHALISQMSQIMQFGANLLEESYATLQRFLNERAKKGTSFIELCLLEDCDAIGGEEFVAQVKQNSSGREVMILKDLNYQALKDCAPGREMHTLTAFNYEVCEREHGAAALAPLYAMGVITEHLGGGIVKCIEKGLCLRNGIGSKFLKSLDFEYPCGALAPILNSIEDESVADIVSNTVKVNLRLFSLALGSTHTRQTVHPSDTPTCH